MNIGRNEKVNLTEINKVVVELDTLGLNFSVTLYDRDRVYDYAVEFLDGDLYFFIFS